MYSISVTGYIPQQKSKEFKQHMRQLIGLQNEDDIKFSVLQDMIQEDQYHVKVSFMDQQSMFSFMKSDNYTMISGSFRTLGMLKDRSIIKYSSESMK